MSQSRLSLALDSQPLPPAARVLVLGLRRSDDLPQLVDPAQLTAVTGYYPDHAGHSAQGITCLPEVPEGTFDAAVVFLPRSKGLARAWVAAALDAVQGGPVLIDGAKTDGADGLMKELRKRVNVGDVISKSHGKSFWISGTPQPDWRDPGVSRIDGDFVTRLGVFSADKIDAGSALLAQALPAAMPGRVLDLGGGWGFLTRAALSRTGVSHVDLVEADHAALSCARLNLPDARVAFHWADATDWQGDARADWIIMNPPFHTGRAAEPALGQAFIATAAANLSAKGQLWMVANRHLPYERALSEVFGQVDELAGSAGYKLLIASKPLRKGR